MFFALSVLLFTFRYPYSAFIVLYYYPFHSTALRLDPKHHLLLKQPLITLIETSHAIINVNF
jgi:hypothetical protein